MEHGSDDHLYVCVLGVGGWGGSFFKLNLNQLYLLFTQYEVCLVKHILLRLLIPLHCRTHEHIIHIFVYISWTQANTCIVADIETINSGFHVHCGRTQ